MSKECLECGVEGVRLYVDHSSEPLGLGPCLCGGCARTHLKDAIHQKEYEILNLKEIQSRWYGGIST